MSIPVKIQGSNNGDNTIVDAEVIVRRGSPGIRAYTEPARDLTSFTRPFTNPSLGIDLAQNVTFSGNPTVIHEGVNSGALLTGTTTGTTASHLIDSGETFSNISVGMSVKNTTSGTEYALVTAVTSNDLTLDTDILVSGENYEINPIWVGSAVSGTWNFADAGKITITSANNNDEAVFSNDTNQNWAINNFAALTGKVDLDIYDPVQNDIIISFCLNGVINGVSINLNDHIDTGDFAEQSFAIPISSFNFAGATINEMNIVINRSGGTRPTIKFDDFQWEKDGAPLLFEMKPETNEVLRIDQLIFSFADDITSIASVSGATENFTANVLSFDKLMGLTALTNGIGFTRLQKGIIRTSLTFRQISDFFIAGGIISNLISDGTNTFLTIDVEFKVPVQLFGEFGDGLSLTVNDNLSGLSLLNVFARGAIET